MNILFGVPITLIALTFHEYAHGFVSSRLGDPTPNYTGRMTLNPLAHLDPIGTILMILTGFGWAKPVQINPSYYRNPKKGMALTAIAGPAANFILAFAGIFIGMLCILLFSHFGWNTDMVSQITLLFAMRNLNFMVFNLIPLPPLDGFKVLGLFVPNRTYYKILQYERYVIFIIMALSLSGAFSRIIGTGTMFFLNIIWKACYSAIALFI